MSDLVGVLVWLSAIGLAIKGLLTLWIINWVLAVVFFILLSPALPIVGIFGLLTGH